MHCRNKAHPCFLSLLGHFSFHSAGTEQTLLHPACSEPGRPPQLLRPADKSAAVWTIMMVKPGTYTGHKYSPMKRSAQAVPIITGVLLIINATATNWTGITLGHPRSSINSLEELHCTRCWAGRNGSQQPALMSVRRHNERLRGAVRADEDGYNHLEFPLWE